jgi:HEAT repeat protein/YHS domain-containing protein
MTSCPVCNKPVDPIRSRFVAVRNGKVTPYCSPECRDSQSSQPVKMPEALITQPKTPVSGTPKLAADLDSGPVIEILHEPASGVVTSAKDERTTQPTGKIAKEELVEVKATKPRADAKSSGGKDSAAVAGEVNEPKRARTRPSGKHLTRERTDSTEAKAGWDWLDEEPADERLARPGTITESERRARWPFVIVLMLAAAGGGAFFVNKYVLKKKPPVTVPVDADPGSAITLDAPTAAELEPDASAPTKETAVREARKVLLDAIKNGTDRVQRLAAAPLGRTGDPAAVGALQMAVKQEKIAAARIKLAYALARAGDKAGREALVVALALPDRSDKLDAATHLARLGDARGKPLLQSLLAVAQHKLRAAEELARFQDPEALKLLEQIRSDDKSSLDERATATIALYRAGNTKLVDDVKKLLEEKSWRVPAAYALAEIAKDPSVKADLVELATRGVGVKVRAAYALSKLLGDKTDELVPALLQALASQKDQEQFYAAEAILILAGEPQWAEYE